MKHQSTYLLCQPNSIKAEVEKLAKTGAISINLFVATACSDEHCDLLRRASRPHQL